MRQSLGRVAELAGGIARLASGVGTKIIRRRFGQPYSLLLQPATERICGHDWSSGLTARITQFGKLDSQRGKIRPNKGQQRGPRGPLDSKVELQLQRGVLLGLCLPRCRAGLFRLWKSQNRSAVG